VTIGAAELVEPVELVEPLSLLPHADSPAITPMLASIASAPLRNRAFFTATPCY
jgi:hypothetical protein